MSFGRVPSKTEVLGWNVHQLADYMKKMDLAGCNKVIEKNVMNGQRFLNMTENDLQKFPKLHAPLISKICKEINRKEEKRGFFSHKRAPAAPRFPEPDTPQEEQGWGPDEFDVSDEDYESPDADDDDEVSGADYESPTDEAPQEGDDDSDNDYEPPPSEPPDDLPHQLCPAMPMGDNDYCDNRSRVSMRAQPPAPPQRPGPGPPPPSAVRPSLAEPPAPRREQSPHRTGRFLGNMASAPPAPQVDRSKKPSTLERVFNNGSPGQARKIDTADRPAAHSWRPPAEERSPEPPRMSKPRMPKPPLPVPSVSRSASAVGRAPLNISINRSASAVGRPPLNNRFVPDTRHEVQDEVPASKPFTSNTFPLLNRSIPLRPGLPGPPSHSDSLPPNMAPTGSLPLRLQAAISHRPSARSVVDGHHPMPPPPAIQATVPLQADREHEQDMDPQVYVGQVTRGQAEGCLRQVNQDGAFLVRDSSKGSYVQPYTLMVLYQDKVYNIQIRRDHNAFLLGTGLKATETFPRVADIIAHYRHSPLLLIDAKNRGSAQQNQCPLLYPAGYHKK